MTPKYQYVQVSTSSLRNLHPCKVHPQSQIPRFLGIAKRSDILTTDWPQAPWLCASLMTFHWVSLNLSHSHYLWLSGRPRAGGGGHCLHLPVWWPTMPVQDLLSIHSLVAPPQCQGPSWVAREIDDFHTTALCPTHRLFVPLELPPSSVFPVSTDLEIDLGLLKFMREEASVFLAAAAWNFPLPASGS